MLKISTAVLLGVALIAVSIVATGAYFRATAPTPVVSAPAANPVVENAAFVIPDNAITPRSLYLSEATLRARLDDAYEHGSEAQVQALLGILNGRYEHRCCGLPR